MSDFLQTLAEIAIALAGFSGVVVAFGGGIKSLQSFRLSLLLSLSGEVVIFSLLPVLLLIRFDEATTWKVLGILYGLVHLFHVALSFFGYSREESGASRPKFDNFLMAIGTAISAGLLFVGVGGQTNNIQVAYGGLLVFVVFVAGTQFFRLLMHLQSHRNANDA